MKTVRQLACPGTRANAVRLTNAVTTAAGIGHPENTGTCPVFIEGLDAGGVTVGEPLKLEPGENASWFRAPGNAVGIWAVCHADCSGQGEIRYDTPIG
jgi:hypothetical protein